MHPIIPLIKIRKCADTVIILNQHMHYICCVLMNSYLTELMGINFNLTVSKIEHSEEWFITFLEVIMLFCAPFKCKACAIILLLSSYIKKSYTPMLVKELRLCKISIKNWGKDPSCICTHTPYICVTYPLVWCVCHSYVAEMYI